MIHTVGGGLGQLLQWRDIAAGLGVEIRYESKVTGFHGNERHIEGVRVLTPEGEYDLVGRAVICCSGGFQASAEMRARYLGPFGDLMRVRGSKHDTGEVLNMLIALGAMTAGHWQGAHATPIGAEFAGRRHSAAAGWPRQLGQPLRVQVRHHGEHARPALLR